MKRREFFAAGGTAIGGAANSFSTLNSANSDREYFEFRHYRMRPGSHKNDLNKFIETAAISAWNRSGKTPVGVFLPFIGPDSLNLFVILPHKNLESVSSLYAKLRDDKEYQKAGADYLNASQNDPLYIKMNSSLLKAFPGFPKIQVSKVTGVDGSKVYELRVYESHSKNARQLKIDQFCVGSTIEIFHKSCRRSVFYGETIVGSNQPSLYYMPAFENIDDLEDRWARFSAHPEWIKLSKYPRFTGTISHSTKWFLNPTSYSQV